MIAITDFASLIVAAVILCFALAICIVTIMFVLAMSSKDGTRQSRPINIHLELHQAAPNVYTNAVSDPRQLYLPEPRQQYPPEQMQHHLPAAQQKYLPAAKRDYWTDSQSILLNEHGEVIDRSW